VWSRDVEEHERVYAILIAAGCTVWNATGTKGDPHALNIDIGVVAQESLLALDKAGYSFRWHPDQYEMNRGAELFGIPVEEVDQS
jgi:hypothetical protein